MSNESYIKRAASFIKEDFEVDLEGDLSSQYATKILADLIKESAQKHVELNEVNIEEIIRKVIAADELEEHEPMILASLEEMLMALYTAVKKLRG